MLSCNSYNSPVGNQFLKLSHQCSVFGHIDDQRVTILNPTKKSFSLTTKIEIFFAHVTITSTAVAHFAIEFSHQAMFTRISGTILVHLHVQYRSKVSYHLSSRFSRDESLVSRDETLVSRYETLVSRDETLVSREPLKRIFWNKSHTVSLRETD